MRRALALLLIGLATAATADDVEEDRVERALAAMPDALAGLGRMELPCGADSERSAERLGGLLWRSAVAAVRGDLEDAGDDRPLYWQRLAALRDAPETCPAATSAFEAASRGFGDVRYDAAADVRVLVTGFDPFLLDRDITQSNPSGVAALYLDGLRSAAKGRIVEIQSLVVPVRFADFDAGLVEREIVPLALRERVDLLVTVSMGRDAFDLERFPGRRRSATAPDNRNVLTGGSAAAPVLPRLGDRPLEGPEFVEFTLPAATMLALDAPRAVRDNRTVTTLEGGEFEAPSLEALAGSTAVRGGGGGYLSNEISYRVLNALRGRPDAPRSGHIHTPRIRGHEPEAVAAIARQVEALILAAAGKVAAP